MLHCHLPHELVPDADPLTGDSVPCHLMDYPYRLHRRNSTTVFSRRKILIVDDAPAASFMLQKLLEKLGQDVSTIQSPSAAIETADLDPPDVVISDITMPGVDGYELARQLRRNPALQGVTLVALTGLGTEEDKARSSAAGFDYHLVKPVGVDDLKRLLANLTAKAPN